MAIVVLVLWLLTAGAGFYLLVTSNLSRARPAITAPASKPAAAAGAESAAASLTAPVPQAASVPQATAPQATPVTPEPAPAPPLSKREIRRAARDRFDPPSLTAAKKAPIVPGLPSLFEFAHPASALVGLGFWLGYTLVHYRTLGWIAFGLLSATVCLGLSWFAANARAARRPDALQGRPADEPGPSFSPRLIVLHGGAAALTFTLAALAAFVLGR